MKTTIALVLSFIVLLAGCAETEAEGAEVKDLEALLAEVEALTAEDAAAIDGVDVLRCTVDMLVCFDIGGDYSIWPDTPFLCLAEFVACFIKAGQETTAVAN